MKPRHIFIFTIMLLSVASCKKRSVEKPENLIPKSQMTEILLDVALVNAARGIGMDVLKENKVIPDTYIYQKHQVDSLQFAESNTYYASKPAEYAAMYKEVEKKLKEMKEAQDKAREEERKTGNSGEAKRAKEEETQ
ncbi:DUF4296 domain-containing protein [Sinomicrobium pectinilyticum]|uniref:DUF4296 domain-containing protein n=1 Tax=Sinomicrobium pectinilyticum TaxID=1084421 RepID=A0A3N0E6D6_SINP1|nr:DUF4296 domain-containing protein [Sinomicrobium pectinilyticum]RNL83408.1 DUF4296 domain-containing protein [Sinomicrobium pectinilyticum]